MVNNIAIQNSFVGGLKTEATGLTFPENACIDTDNCVFSLVGDVLRRGGIDYETNSSLHSQSTSSVAVSTYRWRNAGGDGTSEILVCQVGTTLTFYRSSAATITSPLSTQNLSQDVTLTAIDGQSGDASQVECQYADGNGYLFIFHPYCDPLSLSYDPVLKTITPNTIAIQIRDLTGVPDGLGLGGNPQFLSTRPLVLDTNHQYNLMNQGWAQNDVNTAGQVLHSTSSAAQIVTSPVGSPNYFADFANTVTMTSDAAITVTANNQKFTMTGTQAFSVTDTNGTAYFTLSMSCSGTVKAINGTSITLNVTSQTPAAPGQSLGASRTFVAISSGGGKASSWTISVSSGTSSNLISVWHAKLPKSGYPSNADVWWYFKNTSNAFDPLNTVNNVTLSTSQAPQGHYILNAFNQQRDEVSSIADIDDVITYSRPSTGVWFAGRVWYTGLTASQAATTKQFFYTWTENIYFSQIVTDRSSFGQCFQTNDPTDQNFFDLLPSDGGVIVIQGSGRIYKLIPIQAGLLVFAANGVWFIAGSQGGFTATDYTVHKISSIQSISSTSFVIVEGYPLFWNEEGIYAVKPSQSNAPYQYGGLMVEPITVGTIQTFYDDIPKISKQYVKAAYHPIDYVIQWIYRSTTETDISDRYRYDRILNFNTVHSAFYPYTISSNNHTRIKDIIYMNYPAASTAPDPGFKYLTSVDSASITFSEENDTTRYKDWYTYDTTGVDFTSYFTTGYILHGQTFKWKPEYVQVFSRNSVPTAYTISGIWDYALTGTTRVTNPVTVTNAYQQINFGQTFRRHRIRGTGSVFQMKISSVSGSPFDIIGWSFFQSANQRP